MFDGAGYYYLIIWVDNLGSRLKESIILCFASKCKTLLRVFGLLCANVWDMNTHENQVLHNSIYVTLQKNTFLISRTNDFSYPKYCILNCCVIKLVSSSSCLAILIP